MDHQNHIRPYIPSREGSVDTADERRNREYGTAPANSRRYSAHPMATWHMDQTVTSLEADGVEIVTVWIAMVDTSVENGCLQVLPDVRPTSAERCIVMCVAGRSACSTCIALDFSDINDGSAPTVTHALLVAWWVDWSRSRAHGS